MNNLLKYRLGAMAVFAAALFLPHFLWEATVVEDTTPEVTIFGSTALAGFWEWVQIWTTKAAYNTLHLFFDNINLPDATTLRWDNGNTILIIPSCTAIKQYWLQLVIIPCTAIYTYFTVPTLLKHKRFHTGAYLAHTSAYTIICVAILVIFNILRIYIATWAMGKDPALYHFLHGHILRYGFYGIMFLSWVIWVEYLARNTKK